MQAVKKVRVLLAEDHETVREGLKMIIERQPDLEIIGEAADGREALDRAISLKPDVVVMDISMPGLNGLIATRKLKEKCPEIQVVALTRHNEGGYLQELLHAGAAGYVLKQSSSEELIRAIRAVGNGKSYLDPAITNTVVDKYASGHLRSPEPGSATLTGREAEVLRLIASGYSNKEIAAQLEISVKTVEAHKANSMRKTGLSSRIDIVNYALLQGWLTSS
jgi:DNA-binding NarL/FixJ family response regulator